MFLPRGVRFGEALKAALERGEVTSELRVAFWEPLLLVCDIYQLVAVLIVLILMVLKPF